MSLNLEHRKILHEEANNIGLGEKNIVFLEKMIIAESSGRTGVRPAIGKNGKPVSTAYSIAQIADAAWSDLVRDHPDKFNDRNDVRQNIRGAAYINAKDEKALEKVMPKDQITAGDFYLAYFSGRTGATNLLKADPSERLDNVLSKEAMDANGIIKGPNGNITSRGVRLKISDGETLYFKDFKVADIRAWANHKMGQPYNYEGMSSAEQRNWRTEHNVPSSTPEAFGSIKGFLEVIVDIVKAIASAIGGLFSNGDKITMAGGTESRDVASITPPLATPIGKTANNSGTKQPNLLG